MQEDALRGSLKYLVSSRFLVSVSINKSEKGKKFPQRLYEILSSVKVDTLWSSIGFASVSSSTGRTVGYGIHAGY